MNVVQSKKIDVIIGGCIKYNFATFKFTSALCGKLFYPLKTLSVQDRIVQNSLKKILKKQ